MRRSTGFWSEQVFDAIPDALLLIDSTGEVLEANREAGNLFGGAPALLRGLPEERLP
jgi:PAS domain-containing protein